MLEADYKESDKDKKKIFCSEINKIVQRVYCESFCFGAGCKNLKECWKDKQEVIKNG